MNKLIVFLLMLSLLVGSASIGWAQRGYHRGRARIAPRARGYRRPYYGARYYHAAPYRSYGGRAYYRPRPYYGRSRTVIVVPRHR